LPIDITEPVSIYKKCGWDPTDPEEGNPYLIAKNGTLVSYDKTVFVEKGNDINYLANVLILDMKGKDITKQLTYKEIDTSALGSYDVKYTFKLNNGGKLKTTVKYEIIDTTVPIVTISKDRLTYYIESKKALNKSATKEAIEELVDDYASSNEGDLEVFALPKDELIIGDNHVRAVATDSSGNVGSQECVVEIKVKEKQKEIETKKKKEEETTKKKKKKKKEEETTKKKEDETKEQETTIEAVEETAVTEEETNGGDFD